MTAHQNGGFMWHFCRFCILFWILVRKKQYKRYNAIVVIGDNEIIVIVGDNNDIFIIVTNIFIFVIVCCSQHRYWWQYAIVDNSAIGNNYSIGE